MSGEDGFVVRIRGLPWQATRQEIIKFFDGVNVMDGENGIFMTLSREGRPSGEAYVELESEEDYNLALNFNHKHMGSRYIEVFASKKTEMDWISRKHGNDLDDTDCHEELFVRLRGLPFSANKDDVIQFFTGLDLVMDGMVLPTDHTGRSTGEAYIQFASRDYADKAMTKHKDKIGHRYIEIFKSSFQEFRTVQSYMSSKGYHGGGGGAGGGGPGSYGGRDSYDGPPSHGDDLSSFPYHRMRPYGHPTRPVPYPNRARGGSPYGNGGSYGPPITGASRGPPPPGASRRTFDYGDNDFRGGRPAFGGRYGYDSYGPSQASHNPPMTYGGNHSVHMRGLPYKTSDGEIYEFFLPLRPLNVQILIDDLGRPSGEADVDFATHEDAVKAMNKDKAFIQKRYIELFLHSNNNNNGSKLEAMSPNRFRNGGPSADNGNGHRMGAMGGWSSTGLAQIHEELMRSRV